MSLILNIPQKAFITSPKPRRAYVAGFGSGKTFVGSVALCEAGYKFPRMKTGYFGATFMQVRDVFYPTIDEVAHAMGMTTKVRTGVHEVDLFCCGQYRSTIICRSMDNPETIVGFKIGRGLLDELDVLKIDKAELAYNKVDARMRDTTYPTSPNDILISTTPEGFKFVYKKFVEELTEKPYLTDDYGLYRASTFENAKNLPAGYIEKLYMSYPIQLVDAYLKGMFVNLTSGSVYPEFDRTKNNCDSTVERGERLIIGMDFNVNKMAAVVYGLRSGGKEIHALDEFMNYRDTPALCEAIKRKYGKTNTIDIYPDASGGNTSSKNASQSDFSIIEAHGFNIAINHNKNMAVKDRISSVNAMICNGRKERRLKINVKACKVFTSCLEKQVYNEQSEPDKKAGFDHANDAGGYPIATLFPINKPVSRTVRSR